MDIKFKFVSHDNEIPKKGISTAYLHIDNWNDFSFVTMFYLSLHDEDGTRHDIGNVKIGFIGQETSKSTYSTLTSGFNSIPEEYFSLGQSTDYYANLALLSEPLKQQILISLNDMVFTQSFIDLARDEDVFRTSLLRSVSLSVLKGQYHRALNSQALLTDYEFTYVRSEQEHMSGVNLEFKVEASSTPSTNIHAVIGRNGVGKTTLLNGMIEAITNQDSSTSRFCENSLFDEQPISEDYFSSLVSVSFSAFDFFNPPTEQPDPSKGTCYFYIGLKDREAEGRHRTIPELWKDCTKALTDCFRDPAKTKRWKAAIKKLSSDENFDSMNLSVLEQKYKELKEESRGREQSDAPDFREQFLTHIKPYLKRMSSGHAIVLLTITRLVATVEEKTLVLLDEPESHLHPPLLSAFIRALSDLLHEQNGVAIIATHSPVVLQEVPKSCVWKVHRVHSATTYRRPNTETFGENVGVLTREVFGLEVTKSGFYDLLVQSVEKGATFQDILIEYDNQLGFEGRAILKALVMNHEGEADNDAIE